MAGGPDVNERLTREAAAYGQFGVSAARDVQGRADRGGHADAARL
jgi:hypothetical protein